MKILFSLIYIFIAHPLLSQSKQADSLYKIPFDTNKIKDAVRLSNTSEVFSYDSLYIWNDKRSLSEIMDARPGYFVYDFGLGGRNDIHYNSRYSRSTGIFRDGVQINDNFFQGFDIQNISVNEIDKIEEVSNVSSFFYGINTFSKSINIISKDFFQQQPFSQLRFSQDRYGSLYADAIYSQPFSRKVDIQLGVTKHSLDGRYENSVFDIWRGRSRLNFFLSPKFNAKINFYLDKYDRGLNEGLVYSPDENNLSDPGLATVVNTTAKENLENYYYDISLNGRFFKNQNSLSKLKIYSNNSLRHLANPDSILPQSSYGSGFNHSLLYGIELYQNIFIKHNKNFSSDLIFGGNGYFNIFSSNLFDRYQNNYYSLKTMYNFNFKNLFVSAFLRNDNIVSKNYLNAGVESNIKIIDNENIKLQINGGISRTEYLLRNDAFFKLYTPGSEISIVEIPRLYYEVGGKLKYDNLTVAGELYAIIYDNTYVRQYGTNTSLHYNSKYSEIIISYSYSQEQLFPQNYLKGDLAFKNELFNRKLKLKTGFNFKYYSINLITTQDQSWYSYDYTEQLFPQKNQFIVDFYIGARIGKANINLTIANIFNSLVYNTYIFPLENRGGFVNAISRFTIVWDFLN